MLQNAYLLAKIGAETAENERIFANISPNFGNYPTRELRPRPEEVRLALRELELERLEAAAVLGVELRLCFF